ncbi:MAG: hypothetical protein DBX59_04020 [Bacillota bacterium]|nr:MAG: hypothetical protein DBX59_04020 [Bacillota bacterium]
MAKQRTEAAARRSFVKLCAFIALFLSAIIFVIGGLLAGSKAGTILDLIAKVALLIGIAFPAYDYVRGLNKVWKIIYWVALIIYALGCTFGVLSGFQII